MHTGFIFWGDEKCSQEVEIDIIVGGNDVVGMGILPKNIFKVNIVLVHTVMDFKSYFSLQNMLKILENGVSKLYLVEDLDIRPEILFSSAWSLFALLKRRANKDQNFLFVFHYSHSA